MSTRAYTVLGWGVWQVAKRVARRKLGHSKTKLGAAAVAAGVLAAGAVAARLAGHDDS